MDSDDPDFGDMRAKAEEKVKLYQERVKAAKVAKPAAILHQIDRVNAKIAKGNARIEKAIAARDALVKEEEETKAEVAGLQAELAALQSQAQAVTFKSLPEDSLISVATAQLQSAFPEFARVGPAGVALERWLAEELRPGIEKHIAAAALIRDEAVKSASDEVTAAASQAAALEVAVGDSDEDDDMEGSEAVGPLKAFLADAEAGKKVKRVIRRKKVVKHQG